MVTARIEVRGLGHTSTDIQNKLKGSLVLTKGMTVEYGGVYQTQQESFRGPVFVALAAIALVFIILLFEFGEFVAPFSILTVRLLSLVSVVSALWITGITFNMSSFVGLTMVIGGFCVSSLLLFFVLPLLYRILRRS